MFSIITMELSTSMPTPKASPPMETTFKVIPAKYIMTKVATTLIIMELPTTNVALIPLKIGKDKDGKQSADS